MVSSGEAFLALAKWKSLTLPRISVTYWWVVALSMLRMPWWLIASGSATLDCFMSSAGVSPLSESSTSPLPWTPVPTFSLRSWYFWTL
ncbi:hypothetical protein D3C78_1683900 [compost metagenome]